MPSPEKAACKPVPVNPNAFNKKAVLPYRLALKHIHEAMNEFVTFLGFIDETLHRKGMSRLECIMMPANFSSLVGEFVGAAIPRHCKGLVRNRHHNGHPDLLPAGHCAGDSILNCDQGIEVKGSRFDKGWQGHNAEDAWLMVFVFDSNRPADLEAGIEPRSFRFRKAFLGRLTKADWKFSGRSETSRRTITASVTPAGMAKMKENWLYDDEADRLVG